MTIRAVTTSGQHIRFGAIVATWTGLLNGDTGAPLPVTGSLSQWLAACNNGTLGAAGNLRWEGSVDGGTTWYAMSDDGGTALNQTAFGLKVVKDRPLLVRPNVTAGDGTTNLTAILVTRP